MFGTGPRKWCVVHENKLNQSNVVNDKLVPTKNPLLQTLVVSTAVRFRYFWLMTLRFYLWLVFVSKTEAR